MSKMCWVISSGAAGMENQAVSLANAMGFQARDNTLEIKRIKLRGLWRLISPYIRVGKRWSYRPRLMAPWPDLVIASGNQAIFPALAIKEQSNHQTKVVYLQNPRIDPKHFDYVVCPAHDNLTGPNVISMIGAPFAINLDKQERSLAAYHNKINNRPSPRIAVLIGGPNRTYKMPIEWTQVLCAQLKNFLHNGMSLFLTTSRRTPKDVHNYLYQELAHQKNVVFWDNKGENPYHAFLELCDILILTADSVSMISEACGTSKPVYVVDLPGGNATFNHFHTSLLEINRIRWLDQNALPEVYDTTAFNQTSDVAKELLKRLNF